MSVQQTLACLFAALAAITCIQGGVTYAELLQVQGGVSSIVNRHLPSVDAIGEIDNAVERIRNKQLRLLLSEPDKAGGAGQGSGQTSGDTTAPASGE